MLKRTLYIYSGSKDISINNADGTTMSYCIGSGRVLGKNVININNQKVLNNIANISTVKYSDFIYSLNNLFVKKGLLFKDQLSLYFLTDLSCKRTELFDTFMHYCNAVYIKEYISKHKIDTIVIDSCDDGFVQNIKSVSGDINLIEKHTNKASFSRIKLFIFNVHFFVMTMVKIFLCKKIINNPDVKKSIKNMFLTRFPLHLKENGKEGKFGEFVKDKDYFLINMITDGYHQNSALKEFYKNLKSLSNMNNVIVLDRYLQYRDLFACCFQSLVLSYKSKDLFKKQYVFNGVDVSINIQNELYFSIKRIPKLLVWEKPIGNLLNDYHVINFYYYLFEYSYGRFFTYSLSNKKENINLIGFQHGPSSENKIVHMASLGEIKIDGNWVTSFRQPNLIMSEDINSLFIYKKAGYENVKLMEKVYRLNYLKDIKATELNLNNVVIVPGLHDGKFIMSFLRERIEKDKLTNYIINLHPRANNGFVDEYSNFQNLKISTSLSDSLSKASKVIGTYSSALVEAYLIGIEVEMIEIPGKINESPLNDRVFLDNSSKIKF